jgi:hypothetical protein
MNRKFCKEEQMSREELETEIRKLSLKDRAALARWIVQSLDELYDLGCFF